MKNSLCFISNHVAISDFYYVIPIGLLEYLKVLAKEGKKKEKKALFYAVDVLKALQRDILSQPRSPLFHARAKIELETTIKRALL